MRRTTRNPCMRQADWGNRTAWPKGLYAFGGSKLFTDTRRTQAMRMRLLNLASVVPRSMRWIVDLSMPARSASRSCVRFS